MPAHEISFPLWFLVNRKSIAGLAFNTESGDQNTEFMMGPETKFTGAITTKDNALPLFNEQEAAMRWAAHVGHPSPVALSIPDPERLLHLLEYRLPEPIKTVAFKPMAKFRISDGPAMPREELIAELRRILAEQSSKKTFGPVAVSFPTYILVDARSVTKNANHQITDYGPDANFFCVNVAAPPSADIKCIGLFSTPTDAQEIADSFRLYHADVVSLPNVGELLGVLRHPSLHERNGPTHVTFFEKRPGVPPKATKRAMLQEFIDALQKADAT